MGATELLLSYKQLKPNLKVFSTGYALAIVTIYVKKIELQWLGVCLIDTIFVTSTDKYFSTDTSKYNSWKVLEIKVLRTSVIIESVNLNKMTTCRLWNLESFVLFGNKKKMQTSHDVPEQELHVYQGPVWES